MKTKAETMYDAVTGIDERYLEEAEAHPARTRKPWVRWVATAAALVLAAGLGSQIWLKSHGPASTGDGGASDGEYYSVYAGPILPLTALGDLDGLCATRDVCYDFSSFQADNFSSCAQVRDRYVLTNQTDREKKLTLCYPVSGCLSDKTLSSLRFTVDGAAVTPAFHMGHGIKWAKNNLGSWNEYRELLESPGNLTASLAPEPALEQSALVYTLVEEVSGQSEEDAVSLRFRIDPASTGLYASGITTYSVNEQSGGVILGFYIDRREAAEQEPCRLVLVGGDLQDPVLDASVGSGTGTWRLERQELPLAEAIEADLVWMSGNDAVQLSQADRAAAARFLEDMGNATLQNAEYDGIMTAGALLSAALQQDRVMYETLELTVPAQGSVDVEIFQEKEASYSTSADAQQGGARAYDLMTQAGSELLFEKQEASVTGLDQVKIIENNFGFDQEKGVTAVTLDPAVPYYWMQLQSK